MAQQVKTPPAMQETWIQSLGWEDPLEGEMATHSSILTMDREAWQATVLGLQTIGQDVATPQQQQRS